MRSPTLLLAVCALLGACGGGPTPGPIDAHAATPSDTSTTSSVSPTAKATPPDIAPVTIPTSTPPALATATAATPAAPSTERPSRIGARHILIQYMGAQHAASSIVRTKEQALAVAQEVLRQVKAGEDFTRLALDYSDEPGAGSRGGSLGVFGHGQMVHEFEDAAFALAPGQFSGIVETPFGFHIIQRTQ
jgi:peptidyl-prolyl cis-trans isomerase NIMA-interacting 1